MMAQLLSQLADSLESLQHTQQNGPPAFAGGAPHAAGKIPVPGVPEWASYFQH
jgi:hypothetical protein